MLFGNFGTIYVYNIQKIFFKMRKSGFNILVLIVIAFLTTNAGNPPPPIVDKKAEKRKADSIINANLYSNFNVDSKNHTYQNTNNEILLPNGLKVNFVKLNRFALPRGTNAIFPDEISQRFNYELAEVEIKVTNTNASDVKLAEDASNSLFVSLKFYATETGSKQFTSQYPLSFGSIYNMMEPAQPDKLTSTYKETKAMMFTTYKSGETKTSKGIIVCVSKAAKYIEKIIVQTQEFGTNKTYACPATL